VALSDGIEGLVHVSELADTPPQDPRDLVQIGDELVVRILRIDSFRKRLALSLKSVSAQERIQCLEQLARGEPACTGEGSDFADDKD
jgi:ribosomal protein S1